MKIAVMQPYFLPYIGYFQMLNAVDHFVIFDDVNFIKRGWINRNFIMIDDHRHWLTIPLREASQNDEIRSLTIAPDNGWKGRMKRSVEHAYRKTPWSDETKEMTFRFIDAATGNLSAFLIMTLREVARILKIPTPLICSSSLESCGHLRGQDRIIQICAELKATEYVNLPGGRSLYESEPFHAAGIALRFIDQKIPQESLSSGLQGSPYISILDLLMRNSRDVIIQALSKHSLTPTI